MVSYADVTTTLLLAFICQVAQLIAHGPMYCGCESSAVALGSTPACVPLLHAIPHFRHLFALQLSCQQRHQMV